STWRAVETPPSRRGAGAPVAASRSAGHAVAEPTLIIMPGPVKTEAVVLRSMRYGEADRIIHLYTPQRGRVGAIAKGVRPPRGRRGWGGRLGPCSRLQIGLREARGALLPVPGAQTVDSQAPLRGDAHTLDAAARACDAVSRLFETAEPHPGVFNLLCRQLSLL